MFRLPGNDHATTRVQQLKLLLCYHRHYNKEMTSRFGFSFLQTTKGGGNWQVTIVVPEKIKLI